MPVFAISVIFGVFAVPYYYAKANQLSYVHGARCPRKEAREEPMVPDLSLHQDHQVHLKAGLGQVLSSGKLA